jgi:hypothetical protein
MFEEQMLSPIATINKTNSMNFDLLLCLNNEAGARQGH